MGRAAEKDTPAVIYRYLLQLEGHDRVRNVRWTFAHPVAETDVVELPTFGRWYVERAVTTDEPGAGMLYCKPV
jgi:hypothetical protein